MNKPITCELWISHVHHPRSSVSDACRPDPADDLRAAVPRGEQTVGALTARSGVSQPAVSKHLGALKQAGLVRDRHEGRQTHYSAQPGALDPLVDWTSQMAGF